MTKIKAIIFLKECERKRLKVPKSVKFYANLFDEEGEKIYRQLYLQGLWKTKPFPGIKPLLKLLKKKYKLAIITSNYSTAVNTFFEKHGMG